MSTTQIERAYLDSFSPHFSFAVVSHRSSKHLRGGHESGTLCEGSQASFSENREKE
jgi:hypothetical protein